MKKSHAFAGFAVSAVFLSLSQFAVAQDQAAAVAPVAEAPAASPAEPAPQATAAPATPASGDAEAGKAKAVLCAGCHGAQGEGKEPANGLPAYPSLAGQIEGYFIKSVNDYKGDVRKDPMMAGIAKGLSDADIANLAAYYASLK